MQINLIFNKNSISLWNKIFLIMRLNLFLMLVGLAPMYANLYSQSANMSIHVSNMPMRDALKQIEQASGLYFFMSDDLAVMDEPVSIDVQDKSFDDVMKTVLKGRGLSYRMYENNLVVITEETVFKQGITVTGTVTDNTGDPLPGVNVVVKGTSIGQVTDVNGRYTINVADGNAVLQFSFVGYMTAEFAVGNQRMINVELRDDARELEEVVIIGYGTQKKANLTGAVEVISEKTLVNRSAPTVAQLIQGVSPNLNIGMTRDAGEPGATRNWQIRGQGNLQGTSSGNPNTGTTRYDGPLILVDGIETSPDHIDPESIESISILKDASSSAIYGSRAPFGVVLITTKKGKNQAARVSYNNNFAFHRPLNVPHFVDALTFVNAYRQIQIEGMGRDISLINTALFPPAQVQRVKDHMTGTYPYEYNIDAQFGSQNNPRWIGNANYDYPSLFYDRRDPTQRHSINVEGGNEKMNFYVSGAYLNQPGLHTWGNDGYKRYNVLANVSAQAADWIRFNVGLRYAKDETDRPLPIQNTTDRYYLPRQIITFGPITPMYNMDGTYQNIMINALRLVGREVITGHNFALNLGGEIEPVKGWKTSMSYHYKYAGSSNYQNPKPAYYNVGHLPTFTTGAASIGNAGHTEATMGSREDLATSDHILINAVSSYEQLFGKHYFKILAGYEQELFRNSSITGSVTEGITASVPSIQTGLGTKTLSSARSHSSNQGYFGRLEYNFNEKYLLELNGRYSGSSRYAKDDRWGFFPSAAVGYVISKEAFWAPIQEYINFLKFRVSYGSVGNCNVGNYLYLSTITVADNYFYLMNGVRPKWVNGSPAIISDDLTWEKIRTLNLGADAAFLNNRLTTTFEWYNRTTVDMVGPAETLPATLGASAPRTNNAELETKGFELMINWRDRISKDLSYNVGFTLGNNKTKITKYRNASGDIGEWYAGKMYGDVWGYDVEKIIQTKEEALEVYDSSTGKNTQRYLYDGVWQEGDFKFVSRQADGTVDEGERRLDNHGSIRIIGNTTPRFNYGFTAGATWKGFDFNMMWQGVARRDFFPGTMNANYFGWVFGGAQGTESAFFKDGPSLDYWRPANSDPEYGLGPNTNSFLARNYWDQNQTNKNRPRSNRGIDRFKLNAGYLRLKNVQVGYTLPAYLSKKVWVERARFYISGENLLTFTSLPKTMEPETSFASDPSQGGQTYVGSYYPITRSISFGLNLTF